MHLLKKALAGDEVRPSRMHTEAGEFCGLGAMSGLPSSAVTWTRAKLSNRYAKAPWWVWDAIRFAGLQLRRTDRVLEMGGGFSTLWIAERCAAVVTVEESAEWRGQIAEMAQGSGVRNIQIQGGPSIAAFGVLYPAVRWDVVVIDSPTDRLRMFEELLRGEAWRRPRLVIFDDTDRAENRPALAHCAGYRAHSFRGFKPQTLHACETTVFVSDGA